MPSVTTATIAKKQTKELYKVYIYRLPSQESCHLQDLWLSMRTNISMQTIRHILKTYDNCISAGDIVDWLIDNDKAMSRWVELKTVAGSRLVVGIVL